MKDKKIIPDDFEFSAMVDADNIDPETLKQILGGDPDEVLKKQISHSMTSKNLKNSQKSTVFSFVPDSKRQSSKPRTPK